MDSKPVRSFKKTLARRPGWNQAYVKNTKDFESKFAQVFRMTKEENYMLLFSRREYVVFETPNWLKETVLPKRL